MAEFVMKDLVRKAGLVDKFIINSSATSREEIGCDTHYGTKAKLREMNIPFSKRKAVQITKQDYDMYDYIIVMDNNNLRNLSYIIGEDTEHKVYLRQVRRRTEHFRGGQRVHHQPRVLPRRHSDGRVRGAGAAGFAPGK